MNKIERSVHTVRTYALYFSCEEIETILKREFKTVMAAVSIKVAAECDARWDVSSYGGADPNGCAISVTQTEINTDEITPCPK